MNSTSFDQVFIKKVELVSLDPDRHPVPDCLRRRADFPSKMEGASGAEISEGIIQA